MNRNILTMMLATVAMIAGIGCDAGGDNGPRSITDISPDRDAKLFWVNHNVTPFDKTSGKAKVAIGQFVVEFVGERIEARAATSGNELFTVAAANFGEGMKMELPGMLYEYLNRAERFELIPIEKIAANSTYASLAGTRMGQRSISRRLASPASDCGIPRAVADYTVDGLRIIDPTQVDIENSAIAIMKELGADVMMNFWIRVGVYQGKATIEDGSIITVTRIDDNGKSKTVSFGNLEATRTLVGNECVLDGKPIVSPGKITYYVNSEKFCSQIRELFLAYVTMASIVSK